MIYGQKFINKFFRKEMIISEEVLMEGTIFKSTKMSIGVFPSDNRNYGAQAYFKVYNNRNYVKSTKIARIHFMNPEYEKHIGEHWPLNRTEKKMLIKILQTNLGDHINSITVWEALIIEYNKSINDKSKHLPLNLPIPDYMQL